MMKFKRIKKYFHFNPPMNMFYMCSRGALALENRGVLGESKYGTPVRMRRSKGKENCSSWENEMF